MRFLLAILMAFSLCGCAGKGKPTAEKPAKKQPSQKAQKEAPQERSMQDRLLKPDLSQSSAFSQKSFGASGEANTKKFKTSDFLGSKTAPVKSYSSSTFLGTGDYGGKDQKFATKDALLSKKSDPAGTQTYGAKKYDANSTYLKGNESSKYSNTEFKSREAIVPGKTSKAGLDATGKALQDKIKNKELSIEEVRELLNKAR